MPRLTPQEKREVLIKKRAELDSQLRAVEAQHRATERKRDTRRKVLAGAIALELMELNVSDPWAIKYREYLGKRIEARSRDLFPFLPALEAKAADAKPSKGDAGKAA